MLLPALVGVMWGIEEPELHHVEKQRGTVAKEPARGSAGRERGGRDRSGLADGAEAGDHEDIIGAITIHIHAAIHGISAVLDGDVGRTAVTAEEETGGLGRTVHH